MDVGKDFEQVLSSLLGGRFVLDLSSYKSLRLVGILTVAYQQAIEDHAGPWTNMYGRILQAILLYKAVFRVVNLRQSAF